MDIAIGIFCIVVCIALTVFSIVKKKLTGLRFTFMTLAFGSAAFTFPAALIACGYFNLSNSMSRLVHLILFGMGMTLTFSDFKLVLKRPKAIFIGIFLQYLIMPFSGFAFAYLFGLTGAVAAGVILIGSCPGGVSSNVLVYIARANVALSVAMTTVSTLVSPLTTPLAMKWLAGSYVQVNTVDMMFSILEMIIAPLLLGLLIHQFLPRLAHRMVKVLPTLAMLAICMIIAVTIAMSRNDILAVGLALFGAVVCHNTAGFLLGYLGARATGRGKTDARTVAIEVGIQNGGMATGLAFNVLKSAQAALGSAVFGPWSAISGTALVSWWRQRPEEKNAPASASFGEKEQQRVMVQ
jgi:BASS family bile acid:Na+ symporter